MPAYSQHHQQHHYKNAAMTVCPSCIRLPMQIKEVQPNWNMASLDFVYECPECGIEVRETVARQ